MCSLFITLEGGEGAGKTTQTRLFAEFLATQGHAVITTREPGGTDLGQGIRHLFLQSAHLSPTTELLLLLSDRAHHVEQVIQPALSQGKVVLSDRFYDSTFAYQGFGHGIDRNLIEHLNQVATGGLYPHLTYWLDIDVPLGLQRAAKRKASHDRMERMDRSFHQRVREGFQALAQRYPHRITRIDASHPPEQVSQAIQAHWLSLSPLLPQIPGVSS